MSEYEIVSRESTFTKQTVETYKLHDFYNLATDSQGKSLRVHYLKLIKMRLDTSLGKISIREPFNIVKEWTD